MAESYQVISNWFIHKALAANVEITPMKLQKLLYLAHGWYLGIKGKPLITSHFHAWKYGPVHRDLYYDYRELGDSPILKVGNDTGFREESVKDCLNFIWERYSSLTAIELSNIASKEHSPWDCTMKSYVRTLTNIISNQMIKNYYQMQYKEIYHENEL